MADPSGDHTARILAALALASALAPLNSTMLSVAIPAIGRALGREAPLLTHALVTSYLVASIVMQSPGAIVALAGMLWMHSLPLRRPGEVIAPLVLMGVGLGSAAAPAQSSAMGAAPVEKSGMAAGMLSTLRYLGGVVGIVVLGAVTGGSDSDPAALLRRATTAFAVALGLAVLAAAALPGHAATTEPRSSSPRAAPPAPRRLPLPP